MAGRYTATICLLENYDRRKPSPALVTTNHVAIIMIKVTVKKETVMTHNATCTSGKFNSWRRLTS